MYMLAKFGDFGERIISADLSDDKKILMVTEACDYYYTIALNRSQVLEWISDLQKIADAMVES